MRNMWLDLRHAARHLRKTPGFSLIAILTLALGIGANTAIFSMVNALLFHPYKFRDLDRLVQVWEERGMEASFDDRRVAPGDAAELQLDSQIFEGLAIYRYQDFNLSGEGSVQPIIGCSVSANFFSVLGIVPEAGGLFTAEQEQPGKDEAVLVSYALWQQQFGGDPRLIGKHIHLSGRVYTVTGIMPSDFSFPVPAQLWVPLALTPAERSDRAQLSLHALARLKAGISTGSAQSALNRRSEKLQREYPVTNAERRAKLQELRKELYAFSLPLFLLLQVAAGFVLMLACANLANLYFARTIARQKEFAVRTALGAGRARLAQLFISETMLISLIAGVVAIAVSFWTINLLRISISKDWTMWVPGWDAITLDRSVLTFTVLLAISVGALFGFVVALHSGRVDLNNTLREAASGSMTRAKARIRSALVIAQVALTFVLLVCAGLAMQGFLRLANAYKGYDAAHVLKAEINLPPKSFSTDSRMVNFYRGVLQRVATTPGVVSVALVQNHPGSNVDSATTLFTIEGRQILAGNEASSAELQTVSPDYFSALRVSLIEGRVFSEADGVGTPPVILISKTMASRYFPMHNAIGRHVKLGAADSSEPWMTIAGIVGDVRQNWWNPPSRAVIYVPVYQAPKREMTLLLRSDGNALNYVHSVRSIVQEADADVALKGLGSLETEISDSIAIVRILGLLLVVFGCVALMLSSVGVYGVLAESVAQRTREIGIRLALGAHPGEVRKLILVHAMKLTAIGLGIGLLAMAAISRAASSLLFGVVTINLMVLAGLAIILVGAALFAAYVPARRATLIDPIEALRF
jgi:putative ABC transport system permease protein